MKLNNQFTKCTIDDLDDIFLHLDEHLDDRSDLVLVENKEADFYVMIGVDSDEEGNGAIYFRAENIEGDYSEEFPMSDYPLAPCSEVFLKICEAIAKDEDIDDYLSSWYDKYITH